jgi:predicted Ser/Thr protein kinase
MPISIACHVLLEPLFGSFHILYQIHFEDGVRWLLRVSATGFKARYDDLIAQSMASEAQTLQVLERETTIPVPEILQFDKSPDNETNCPCILMEYVDGIPFQDCWFDDGVAINILEQR